MSALDLWRSELRALIPRGFLRRDQGEGLFLSDFPRRGVDAFPALKAAGFETVEIRGLARIDGSLDKYRELEAALPAFTPAPRDDTLYLFSLARRLTRFGGDITAETLPLVRMTLLCLDEKDDSFLLRRLPGDMALAQRQRLVLPRMAGQLILNFLYDQERREPSC